MTAVLMLLATALSVILEQTNPSRESRTLATGPPLPYVVENACPFEGCVFRPWIVGRRVVVRTRRSKTAPIAFIANRWDWVRGMTGISITYRPTLIRFTRDSQVPVPRHKGDTLQVLEYVGEGFGTIWVDGRIIEGADLSNIYNGLCHREPDRCDGHIERPGRIEWWVQVENSEGVVGWTDDAGAFGNKDALGGSWEDQMPAARGPRARR